MESNPCFTLPCPVPWFLSHAQAPLNQFIVAVNHLPFQFIRAMGMNSRRSKEKAAFAPGPG